MAHLRPLWVQSDSESSFKSANFNRNFYYWKVDALRQMKSSGISQRISNNFAYVNTEIILCNICCWMDRKGRRKCCLILLRRIYLNLAQTNTAATLLRNQSNMVATPSEKTCWNYWGNNNPVEQLGLFT